MVAYGAITPKFVLEVPIGFPYTDSMKNKNTAKNLKSLYAVGDVITVDDKDVNETYNMVVTKVNTKTIYTMVEEIYNDVNRNRHCDNHFILNNEEIIRLNARKAVLA